MKLKSAVIIALINGYLFAGNFDITEICSRKTVMSKIYGAFQLTKLETVLIPGYFTSTYRENLQCIFGEKFEVAQSIDKDSPELLGRVTDISSDTSCLEIYEIYGDGSVSQVNRSLTPAS